MKKLISAVFLVGGLAFAPFAMTSCDRVKDVVEDVSVPVPFDIPLSFETTIPFGSVSTSTYFRFPEINVDVDVDAKIKEEYPKLSINNLKSAKLSALNIELKKSSIGGSFDAVRNAKIFIKTPDLPEVLVATVNENTSTDKLVFSPNDAELSDYLKSKKNSLILEMQGRKFVLDQFDIKVNPSFKISVGL